MGKYFRMGGLTVQKTGSATIKRRIVLFILNLSQPGSAAKLAGWFPLPTRVNLGPRPAPKGGHKASAKTGGG